MKSFIYNLLSQNSSLSSMRFMALLCLLTAMIIAIYGVIAGRDASGIATLSGVFLAAAMGGKVGQKAIETKNTKIVSDTEEIK